MNYVYVEHHIRYSSHLLATAVDETKVNEMIEIDVTNQVQLRKGNSIVEMTADQQLLNSNNSSSGSSSSSRSSSMLKKDDDENKHYDYDDNVYNKNKLNNDIIFKTKEYLQVLESSLQNKDNENIIKLEDISIISDTCIIKNNPFLNNKKDLIEIIKKINTFFEDFSIVIFNLQQIETDEVLVDYQLSFYYPLPWRPRVIIPIQSLFKFSSISDQRNIISITEKWDINLLDIFLKQLLPRWWDIWHIFSNPTPEYPPIKKIGSYRNIQLFEYPQSLYIETRWRGPSRYIGPPLLITPGFSLFGFLKSSRPNREKYYTVLPVEVQSYRYNCMKTGEEMKQSSWLYHVPTVLQKKILNQDDYNKLRVIPGSSLLPTTTKTNINASSQNILSASSSSGSSSNLSSLLIDEAKADEGDEEDIIKAADYQVGFDNLNLMKSVTGGIMRGNYTLNITRAIDFETKQEIDFRYRIINKRIVAAIDLKGDVDAKKIANALNEIKLMLSNNGDNIISNKKVSMKTSSSSSSSPKTLMITNTNDIVYTGDDRNNNNDGVVDDDSSSSGTQSSLDELVPLFGLQMHGIKTCFNMNGEPCMSIYEMQYSSRLTRLFVEIMAE